MSEGSLTKRDVKTPNFLERVAKETGSEVASLIRESKSPGSVILVLDVSGSMSGVKLGQAKSGGKGYAQEANEEHYAVGVVVFGSDAAELIEPTDDLQPVLSVIDSINVSGSTNMAAGLDMALERLSRMSGNRAIRLVTDGMPDDEGEALAAAQRAKQVGIQISTVGTDDANLPLLKKISSSESLAVKTSAKLLGNAIASGVKLLPNLGNRKLLE